MNNLERLKLQLNNKSYLSDEEYSIYLDESGLQPTEEYINVNYKPLLNTVLSVFETLANDLDLFCSIETEFATTTEAFNALTHRILQIKNKINSVDDIGNTSDSSFSPMYYGGYYD